MYVQYSVCCDVILSHRSNGYSTCTTGVVTCTGCHTPTGRKSTASLFGTRPFDCVHQFLFDTPLMNDISYTNISAGQHILYSGSSNTVVSSNSFTTTRGDSIPVYTSITRSVTTAVVEPRDGSRRGRKTKSRQTPPRLSTMNTLLL